MPAELLPSFLFYCFVSSITPGPANLCSLSAAVRYGRRPALVQWRGMFTGFFLVSMAAAVFVYLLGTALGEYAKALSWAGAAYILYLALQMLRSAGAEAEQDPARPCFRTGLLIQLTNVKVMIYCVTALGSYVLPYAASLPALGAASLFLSCTGPAANLVWLFTGAALQRFFADHRAAVDRGMAAALALCAAGLVLP